MKKYVKWGLVGAIVLGFAGWGMYNLSPQVNKDLKEAPAKSGKARQSRELKLRERSQKYTLMKGLL